MLRILFELNIQFARLGTVFLLKNFDFTYFLNSLLQIFGTRCFRVLERFR